MQNVFETPYHSGRCPTAQATYFYAKYDSFWSLIYFLLILFDHAMPYVDNEDIFMPFGSSTFR